MRIEKNAPHTNRRHGQSMGKKIYAVWISLVLALATAGYLFYFQEKLKGSLDAFAHIQETLSMIHDLQNTLADTEAICRGYILTGEDSQLKLCRTSNVELEGMLKQLDALMAHKPGHNARWKS